MKKMFAWGGVAAVSISSAFAEAGSVTIPETGVDVAGFIGAGITSMGVIAAAAIGGYVAFLLVRKALRWVGKALG